MKIVINICYGGFSISKEAAEFMAKRGNKYAQAELDDFEEELCGKDGDDRWYGYGFYGDFLGYDRSDLDLVAAVEELGERANGSSAKLKVVEIPDNIKWEIQDYDGIESIHEVHKSWE